MFSFPLRRGNENIGSVLIFELISATTQQQPIQLDGFEVWCPLNPLPSVESSCLSFWQPSFCVIIHAIRLHWCSCVLPWIHASTSNAGILCAPIVILEWVKSDSNDHFSRNKVVATWAIKLGNECELLRQCWKSLTIWQLISTPKGSYSGTPQCEHPEMQNPLYSGHPWRQDTFILNGPKLKCCVCMCCMLKKACWLAGLLNRLRTRLPYSAWWVHLRWCLQPRLPGLLMLAKNFRDLIIVCWNEDPVVKAQTLWKLE